MHWPGSFISRRRTCWRLRWAPLVGGTVISKKAWDALPEATRQEMLKSAAEAGKEIQAKSRQESAEAVEAMKKRGLVVHEPTPEVNAAWRKLTESAYPKIRGSIVPAEMFDEVQQLLQKYRAEHPEGKP